MVNLQFYLFDVDYEIEAGSAIIRMWGRRTDGRFVCIKYPQFQPYLLARPKKGFEIEAKEKLLKIKNEEYVVKDVVFEQRIWGDVATPVLKIITNLPKAVPAIRDMAKDFDCIESFHEYDLLFGRRFLLDNKIAPFSLVQAEVQQVKDETGSAAIYICERIIYSGESKKEGLRALAFDIEVHNPLGRRVSAEKDKVVMISLWTPNYRKVISWQRGTNAQDFVEVVKDESELIKRFIECVNEYDPDCLVGYFSDGFDLPYLKKRAEKLQVPLNLGLDGSDVAVSKGAMPQASIVGRMHIDIFQFVRNVVSKSMSIENLKLDEVAKAILGIGKAETDINTLAKTWDENGDLSKLFEYNLRDSEVTYKLFDNLLPNMLEMVNLIGVPIYDVIRMAYSRLVEWYVIRRALDKGILLPNRPTEGMVSQRQADRAQGAFVFEPIPGVYENIAVFDYRSLYPSIIASHNVSPEVMNCSCCSDDPKAHVPLDKENIWFCKKNKGFLSNIIEEIITARIAIKKQLKAEKEKQKSVILEAQSYSLKVLANAFYGYLGFGQARWYCHNCVEATTAWARNYIHRTIDAAKFMGFKVIYSDTDSVFIALENKTIEAAKQFALEVNKSLPGIMELDFDDFYPSGLFVSTRGDSGGAKKRYALLRQNGKIKITGFETVRRNFSPIGKRIQSTLLKILLAEKDPVKATNYVRDTIKDLREGRIPVEDLIITTRLSKPIDAYTSKGPNVEAAIRLQAKGEIVDTGTSIHFVVIRGKGRIRDKVRLPDEVKQGECDAEYYIDHQIVPSIEKIFSVVGINISDELKGHTQSGLGKFF